MSTSVAGDSSSASQEEYDRLRSLANHEAEERRKFSRLSTATYASGDRLRAKELSEKGKRHGKQMRKYNRLARDCIFALNNPTDQALNLIDLHGLRKKESERLLLRRMVRAKAAGEEKVTVIVGMGNNSTNGVPIIKPAVQKICQERGLANFPTDGNKGRIVILLEDYEPEYGDALETSESEKDATTSILRANRGLSRPRVRHSSPRNFRVSPYTNRSSQTLYTITNSASPSTPLLATHPPPPRPPQAPPSRTYQPLQAPRTAQSSMNFTPYYQAPPSRTYQPLQVPRTAQSSLNFTPYHQALPPPHRPLLYPITPARPQARPDYNYRRYDEEAARERTEECSCLWGEVFKVVFWTLVIGLVFFGLIWLLWCAYETGFLYVLVLVLILVSAFRE